MKELQVEHLKKTVGEKRLFDDLSFLIHEKDRIGLIGVNGTGKSTLLNILSGKSYFDGDVSPFIASNDYTIASLTQTHDFDDEETVASAVFRGESKELQAVKAYELALMALEKDALNPKVQEQFARSEELMNKDNLWTIESSAKSMLNKLGVDFLDKKIGELSGGQQKRVQLANVLLSDCDLLLLDEPTNHLDYASIQWLAKNLQSFHGAILFVTHDRYFLDEVANRVFELDSGKLLEFKGNYQDYLEQKAVLESEEELRSHKQKQLYKQELAWVRKGVEARRTKQQARLNRFDTLKESLPNKDSKGTVEMDFASQRIGKKVLILKSANLSIDGKTILSSFDLLIQKNSRIGITGENGSGKSTLLNVLASIMKLDSGELEVGETVEIAYYRQQNEELPNDKRMIRYLQEQAEEVKHSNGETIGVAEMLERFLFPRHMHGTLIGKLSGGEKRRLYLLKLLMKQPNVLLLDEPTNDLDIQTLTILEDYIQGFQGAVLSVSHDRYFLDKTMNELLLFKGNGEIKHSFGTMSELLEKEELVMASSEEKKEKKPILEEKPKKEKTRLDYMEQKEWATIEDEIDLLEERIEAIDTEMNENGSDFGKLSILQKELDEKTKELEEKYERWEYLSEYVN